MFVGRERELNELESAYESDAFQMIAVYGRRRVGKTALLNEFISDKQDAYFFTAQQTTARDNLEALSITLGKLRAYPGDGVRPGTSLFPSNGPVYQSYQDALVALFEMGQRQRTVFVIDEYPYLAESYPAISSLLQTLIDRYKATSKLFLVLCGSSTSFMEEQVLGEKSPLYGRRTAQIHLRPFDAFSASELLGTDDSVAAIELYALVGGIPLYLEQLDARRDIQWNIANRLLPPDALLSNEPENFLFQEVRSPARYNAIVGALASGCVRPQEISDRTGISSALVSQYLERLERLSVVRRTVPAVSRKKRQVRYEISDNLFRFHYRFGVKYLTAIEAGMSALVAERIVSEEFSTFVGPVFEDVCQQWLLRQAASGEIKTIPLEVGSWWGTNPSTREQEEIDVVLRGDDGDVVVGECKWNNAPVDASVLGRLKKRASLIDGGESAELYLFSKSGFEDECRERARQAGNVHLVTAKEMFG